jgi:excisionase family DNA binding protein
MESPLNCKAEIGVEHRLLTIREAAGYLAVSVSTLYGWVWQRRVPFVKVGRALRFDLQDLEDFIEANKHRPPQKFSYSGGPR